MSNFYEKSAKNAVREKYKDLLGDQKFHAIKMAATFDLWHGPHNAGEEIDTSGIIYPGFESALDFLKEKTDQVCDLWIDTQCDYASENEPNFYQCADQCGDFDNCDQCASAANSEDWIRLSAKEVKAILIGKELANYL